MGQQQQQAEFEGGGLASVSKFFGTTSNGVRNVDDPQPPTIQHQSSRLGVGALPQRLQDGDATTTENNFLSKVLKRKRPRDVSIDNQDSNNNEEDDDDDEEEGRTTAISNPTRLSQNLTESFHEEGEKTKKKKKKKGKKERNREKESTSSSLDQQQSPSGKQQKEEQNGQDSATLNAEPSRPKFRKKKIRSRQKNIRKDKRAEHEKPEHLRLNSPNFSGHFLTSTTRVKLNLPPSGLPPMETPEHEERQEQRKQEQNHHQSKLGGTPHKQIEMNLDKPALDPGSAPREHEEDYKEVDDYRDNKSVKKIKTKKKRSRYKNLQG